MTMEGTTRVLLVEDLPTDAELAAREVERAIGPCEFRRVETRADYLAALEEFQPAFIVSDYKLPAFDGMAALELALERAPDVPFIVLTGSMNEDTAVECLKAGAWDYVIKEHLKRLGPAVVGALQQQGLRRERAKVAHALEASETRYRRLFEAAKDGILILDADNGKIVDVNPFLVESTGYPREHFLGRNLWEIGPFKDVAASKDSFADLQAGGYVRYEDLPLKTSDGGQLDVEFVSNVYRVDGQRVIQCNIRDITARKRTEAALRESEQRFRDIFFKAAIGKSITGTDGRFAMVNQALCDLLGYSSAELTGMSFDAITHPDDRAASAEHTRRLLAGEVDRVCFEKRYVTKAGRSLDVLMTAFLLRDAAGKPLHFIASFQDITERKLAEEALREREAQLSEAMQMARAGHWEYDVARDRFTFNDTFYRIFRTTAAQVGGYQMSSAEYARRFLHPDDVSRVGEEVRAAVETADPEYSRQVEHRILYADGGIGHITVRFFVEKDAHGRTVRTYGVNQDITERKRAEEKLQAAFRQLDTLLGSLYAGVMSVSEDGRVEQVNQAFCDLFDLPTGPGSLRGLTSTEMLQRIAGAYAAPAETLARIREVTARGNPVKGDEVALRDGRVLLVDFIPIVVDGQARGRIWHHQDVTRLKRAEGELQASERRFRTLVESMDDAVITVDREGRVTSISAKYLERLGFDVPNIVGKTGTEAFGPEAGAPHDAAHARVLAGDHSVYEWQLRVQGDVRFMQTSASPLRDARGQVVGAVRVSRDVTEARKMHEQLLLSERMTSMGTLAAGVAHEINNPLAATMANLEFARRELEPLKDRVPNLGESLEALKDASETAERVRLIVRDLKVFSRADEERRSPVDVRLVLESAVRMVWNEIRHRATLQRKYADAPPVLANEARLGQVFLNLLVNAAQAIPEGHADTNVIGLRVATDPAGRVVIEVRDTGAGIPPEVRDHVFEPFFTTKPVGVGTGLGLAICQRIVAELGGEIGLDSEVGQGTTVRVRLPVATAQAAAALPVPTPMSRRRGRILVVDDEATVARAIARALGRFHQVATVRSGQEALVALRSGAAFDLILCDVMMPDMTGAELYDELARTMPEMAAAMVFMTGGAFTPAARAFLDRVPNERVEKPIDTKGLLALMNRLLR
jgi:two-component system, cell cycle sensor histidine kinase and response regulator CckA